MVRTYDLANNPIVRGASWKFVCNYLQADGVTPIDGLEFCTAQMRVRRAGDDDLVWPATIDAGTGKITVLRDPDDTTALNFSAAVYFVDVIFTGETRTILTGSLPTR